MTEHLNEETLELLSSRKLRGAELLGALKHIESCEKCRSQIKLPSREEILKRLEPDPQPNFKPRSVHHRKR